MASSFSYDIFRSGRLPTANGGEKVRKSASMTSKLRSASSPSTTGRSFLPRGVALEHWTSKSMKHSSSSPSNLRALADKPLTPTLNEDTNASVFNTSTFSSTPAFASGPQRMRALVYNWPAHFCKESLLQVTPGPVRAPYELAVSYDLRARSYEFGKQKPYIAAFDVESLRKKFACGMGVNPLEMTNTVLSRDCCCSDVIPLTSSHGQVTVKLQIASTSDAELFVLLRVFRSANLKSEHEWFPVGDAVVVRVDQISDSFRKTLEETVFVETMAEDAPLTDDALQALSLQMEALAKLDNDSELQDAEVELTSTEQRLAEESEKRRDEHIVTNTQLQECKRIVRELKSKLKMVEKATAEAEQTLAKLSTTRVD
mmetsp:Transcript_708/g.1083  ORF Transcript_708/g.1083 Transcript_708/m.1083 type:complete len:371 (-) Transcript_708:159-1271(-)